MISYMSTIRGAGSGKATLPSVETWGTNMSLLRDPPKSIHTRRINKVGETSSITSMIDDSGNRVCEAISVYPRGVNNMVSVSYGQGGGNGLMNGNTTNTSGNAMASLPYKIMNGGAFRPPNMKPQNLLPLSRLPRVWFDQYTNPEMIDFSKKMRCATTAENTREVKNTTIKASIRPTQVMKFETPIIEPFEVKYVIQNPIKVSARSGNRTQDLTSQNVLEPTKEISINPLHVDAKSNFGSSATITYLDNNNLNTERYVQNILHTSADARKYQDNQVFSNNNNVYTENYLQDALHMSADARKYQDNVVFSNNNNVYTENYLQDALHMSADARKYQDNQIFADNNIMETDRYLQDNVHAFAESNKNRNIQITPINEVLNIDIRTKDQMNINYNTAVSGIEKENYVHKEMELERHNPQTYAQTNKTEDKFVRNTEQVMKLLSFNRPIAQGDTNKGSSGYQKNDNITRDIQLRTPLNTGGYVGKANIPRIQRQEVSKLDNIKTSINKSVSEQMHSRYSY
jgi:hypothetical protein